MNNEQRVIDLLKQYTDHEEILPTDKLREECGFDSLDLVDIELDIEEEFDVEIPNNPKWETVQDIINYVSK